MAQSVIFNTSTSASCRAERHMFESWLAPDTFYQYRSYTLFCICPLSYYNPSFAQSPRPPETGRIRKQRLANFSKFFKISIFRWTQHQLLQPHNTNNRRMIIFKEVDIHKIKSGVKPESRGEFVILCKKGSEKAVVGSVP